MNLVGSKFKGDLAGLKVVLSSPQEDKILQVIVRKVILKIGPDYNVEQLLQFPAGSLGKEYGLFLKRNRITPIQFSGKYSDLFDLYPVSIRYIQVHDIFHVLLGFETSILGELGVYSYIQQKNYSSSLNLAFQTGKMIAFMRHPLNPKRVQKAIDEGQKKALHSQELLTVPWENHFEEPLTNLREQYGLK